jgi:7-cyano-7-deazaguanine reductase
MTDYSKAASTKIETVKKIKLVTFPVRSHRPVIEWEYPEFQCLCPISERHDNGTVVIRYQPNKKILESKSVRDYLASWRNKKIWQEYVTEEIADALHIACRPDWLIIEIKWSPRGGIFARTVSKRGNASKIDKR